jgi:hypothetical protein
MPGAKVPIHDILSADQVPSNADDSGCSLVSLTFVVLRFRSQSPVLVRSGSNLLYTVMFPLIRIFKIVARAS